MIPEKIYDIAFHGTSLTSDRVGNWQDSFTNRILASSGKSVRCYDFGLPGGTSLDIYNNSSAGVLLKPWAAVIEAGMNDCPPGNGISVAQMKTNVLNLINLYKAVSINTKLFIMTMNPIVVPPGSSTNAAALPSYYQGLRDLQAVTSGVSLIDVHPLWGTPNSTQIPDGVHPTLVAENAVLVPKLISTFSPLF